MNLSNDIVLDIILVIVLVILIIYLYKRFTKDPMERYDKMIRIRYGQFSSHPIEYFSNTVEVKSTIDGKKYNVSEKYNDKVRAANMLAYGHAQNMKLIQYLQIHYPDKQITKTLTKKYKVKGLFEIDPASNDGVAFSLNKGEEIGMCVKNMDSNKKDWKPVDKNAMTHVFLHELAHVGATSYGSMFNKHNAEFKRNFEFLKNVASEIGMYNKIDYSKNPVKYCNISIVDKQ